MARKQNIRVDLNLNIRGLKKIAEVARKYKVILLSDETYGELHHSGKHVSIARFYPEGTIISSGIRFPRKPRDRSIPERCPAYPAHHRADRVH